MTRLRVGIALSVVAAIAALVAFPSIRAPLGLGGFAPAISRAGAGVPGEPRMLWEEPRLLWERDLGDGYSGIASHDGRLYTMVRGEPDGEAVVAIDADTGETLWERANPAPFRSGMNMEHGPGPHSTPLLANGRLFTVGVVGRLQSLVPATGEVLWSRELWDELGGKVMDRGYSCSPIAWRDMVIVAVGGAHGLVAFGQEDGEIRWGSPILDVSPSSPIRIEVAGQTQLVFFAADEVVGLDPETGARLWGHPHRTQWGLNVAQPVFGSDGILIVSSAYDGGARALQLTLSDGRTLVEELWHTNKLRVHHGNLVRIEGTVYGSSGDFGPAPLSAVDVQTGEVLWRDRSFAKATLILDRERVIVLDEDGVLGVATLSPEGLVVQSRLQVLDNRAWTRPTLVDNRLYMRDRKRIVAVELSS